MVDQTLALAGVDIDAQNVSDDEGRMEAQTLSVEDE
jgi:hypothetical protein